MIKDFVKAALAKEMISGIFSLRRSPKGKIDYGLITDIELIDEIEPFYPFMPVNAGQQLSRFTPLNKPIAAIIRPCEFRAFVELVKRQQVGREDFLIITYSCGGVYPLGKNAIEQIDHKLSEYWQQLEKHNQPEGVRDVCRSCEYINPAEADIYIDLVSKDKKIWLRSSQAEAFSQFWKTEPEEGKFGAGVLEEILEKRRKVKKQLFAEIDTSQQGLDGLINIFGKCVGCHGCNAVCPICYCSLCDFESYNYDYDREILEKELEEKGGLRLPPDTLFFHLGRLSHMSFSCVGCGMCSDVCPVKIPVAMVFKKTGEQTAALFDFEAGRSVTEEIPVMVYKEEEFEELGE